MTETRSGRNRHHGIATLMAAAGLLIAATGCGDDDSSSESTATGAATTAATQTTEATEEPPSENADTGTDVADVTEVTEVTEEPSSETADTSAEGSEVAGSNGGVIVVDHDFGSTEMPASYERVVAVDEYAGLDLLSIGIVPTTVFTSFGSEIGQDLLAAAGSEIIEVAPTGFVADEVLLAEDPDLVVFTSFGMSNTFDTLSPRVPVLPFPEVPWRDKLAFIGEAFDRSADTDAITAALEGEAAELKAAVGDASPSVSVLIFNSGLLATASGASPSTPLLLETGFEVPESQRAGEGGQLFTPLSEELLLAEDADIIVVFSESVYEADKVTAVPGFDDLGGEVRLVNGEMWFGTFPLGVYWMLQDLQAIVAGDADAIALRADAASRLSDFEALIS